MNQTSLVELVSPLNSPRQVQPRSMPLWGALFALVAACSTQAEPDDSACARVREGCSCEDGKEDCSDDTDTDSSSGSKADAAVDSSTRGRADAAVSDANRVDAAEDAAPLDGATERDAAADSGSADATSGTDAMVEEEPVQASGFVGEHGPLRVQGNRVVDKAAQPIQLRGMSLFWSQWSDFYLAKNVDVLADEWKATVVRAALGVENEGGYLQTTAPNTAKVRAVVDRAIERGIYVIIDWHDHHAQDHQAQAISFFEEMAMSYGKQPHVIFEVYNEPMDVQWPAVKTYAEKLIATIREAGSTNLIIVGTPNWSQDVDVAANDRIASDQNVAYTLHFYADTHKQALRDKAKVALDKGLPLFVTEWGTCSADGNGAVNEGESRVWLDFMKQHSISWANWALNNKAEACSAIQSSGSATGPWADDKLTPSGRIVKPAIP
jgi:endoglucanase